jgi:SAM-dependent methyltransferase
MFDEFGILACPICGLPLERNGVGLVCANRHSFDSAREGYVNLARKTVRADTREMLNARRAFLEQGHYRPLLDLLNEQAKTFIEHLPDRVSHIRILDAGCGEGYYLGHMQAFLAQQMEGQAIGGSTDTTISSIGIDLSKEAARMAAKRYREPFFIVSNLKDRLPLQDSSMHILLNIFAPRNVEEYSRVLVTGGLLLIAIPGHQHLQPLRERLQLLNIEEDKQQHVLEQFSSHFETMGIHPLTYKVQFIDEQIEQVVTMTPNHWHRNTNTSGSAFEDTITTIDFVVLVLRKKAYSMPARQVSASVESR